ncbi:MAG TPA: hypothetical protein PK530_13335, partial [Anaerolineales bacterium]|nr:hypothetical protein [Anaerolineales bacterium]
HVGEGENWVSYVMVSPDGNLLAASISTYLCDVIGDSYSFIWDLKTDVLLHQLDGESFSAFSQDGSRLIDVSRMSTRKVEWQIATGEVLVTEDFVQYEHPQRLSSDGRRLLTYAENSPLKIFDVETGILLHSVDVMEIGPVQEAYLDGNNQILIIFGQNKVYAYDLRRNVGVEDYSYGEWFRQSLFFFPDGEKYIEIHDAVMELKDVQSRAVFASTGGFIAGIEALTFSPDGHWLVAGGENGEVTVWDLNTQDFFVLKMEEDDFGPYPDKLVFDPTGSFLAVLDVHGTVIVWDILARTHIKFGASTAFIDLGFSESQELFLIEAADQDWSVWRWAYGQALENPLEKMRVEPQEFVVFNRLSFEEKANYQSVIYENKNYEDFLLLWDPNNLNLLFQHSLGFVDMRQTAYTARANLIAMKENGAFEVDLWDVSLLERVKTIANEYGELDRIRFQPHGNLLVWSLYHRYCGLKEQLVQIYNLDTQQVKNLYTHHTGNVYGLDISPDGRILATGSSDGTIRLWQLP